MNKFTYSPDPTPCWRTYFGWGNLLLCLNSCPSKEVFVAHSGLGLGRPHSLPLIRWLYQAQRTLTTRASRICPSLEDFVLHSRLWPQGPQELPRVGGFFHPQQTFTTNGLRNCPLLEDFVLRSGLGPQRASRNCPLSEDFVLHSRLWPLGPQELPFVGGLCHAQQTLTTGPQELPLVGRLCLAQQTLTMKDQQWYKQASKTNDASHWQQVEPLPLCWHWSTHGFVTKIIVSSMF